MALLDPAQDRRRRHGRCQQGARHPSLPHCRHQSFPPESATDPERRKRFELKARAVAALNHPNVVAIYDAGSDVGIDYIVQELIDGESFHARLADGPIPLLADLPIAARQANIVHRALKPENIMRTGPPPKPSTSASPASTPS